MTALADLLIRRITATGPLTVADYMAECLLHPDHGYYSTRDPFGRHGDFTTAPEISQMFGEMLGLCLAQTWIDHGAPPAFVLAELGPGRGTLMADILRATRRVPGFHAAAKTVLVEASATLTQVQRETLRAFDVTWVDSVTDIPPGPMFLVANEFFDALPIRQFQRDPDGWRERMIGVSDGALSFGLSDATRVAMLDHRMSNTQPGNIVETCAPAQAIITDIATRIVADGGAAIVIDYGDSPSQGDTLQALKDHAFDPPLAHPGTADLTAHVDFGALALAAHSATVSALTPQGIFLERLGITQRAQTLAQNLTDAALDQHIAAHRRLTHPLEMGTLFKTIALTPPGSPRPPGFDP
jgi:NADH dehydrogenase [ubiquinone] 1 alpha subcomplex assembly factor 7